MEEASRSPSPQSSEDPETCDSVPSPPGMDVHCIAGLPEDRPQYQKELLYNHYLPYAGLLDQESDAWLAEIKLNLSKAVLLRELRPGVVTWMARLTAYINLYGFKFSKEEHVQFVRLSWELLTSPDMEPRLMEVFTRLLLRLLKKRSLLSPSDLCLDWKPLYKIYEDLSSHHTTMNLKAYPADYEKTLKLLIKLARPYFPPTATEEILAEFRPYFCPHDSIMSKAVAYCSLLLPTYFVQQDHQGEWLRAAQPPYTQWLGELLAFWRACSNSPYWEGSLLTLLARLAEDNLGRLSWKEETPLLFQRLMSCLGLPVYYKRLGVGLKPSVFSTAAVAKWIVHTITEGSSTLDHLQVLMSAVASYYHPTSEGRYSEKLVDFLLKLSSAFCSRLHRERYDQQKPWLAPAVDPAHHLTDSQVSSFCSCLLPAVLDLTMSKRYMEPTRSILQTLASIRPDIFLPPLIQRLESSLDTLTEPHKFTAAIKCLSSVSRSLVRPGLLYPQGPCHVVALLTSVLPGIDCNDVQKTMLVFQLLSIYARLVPLSDLSHLSSSPGLTSHQKKTCLQSAAFLTFLMDFMDRCFALVDNSTSDQIRQEVASSDTHMSSEENSVNSGLVSCFDSLLHQADEKIQVAAVRKLEVFLKGRILEPKVAGRIASGMARTCAKIAPSQVLPSFLPPVCSLLTSCMADTDLSCSLPLGDELMFNLLLLSDLLCLPGCHLVPFMPQVEGVLHHALSLANREGHLLALTVLRHALHSLTHPCLAERSRIVSSPSPQPVTDWGRPSDLASLKMKWFIPGSQEIEAATSLIDNFLVLQVDRLEAFISGSADMSREEVYRSLKTVSSILIGCSALLPPWQEEVVLHQASGVQQAPRRHTVLPKDKVAQYELRGENTRLTLARLMHRLADKLLEDREDDTKSLIALISVLKLVVFQHSVSEESYEKHMKNFYQSKAKLEVKLFGAEKHIRAILLDRVVVQHEQRVVENSRLGFTATHSSILQLLVTLATSHYSKVRLQAQAVLARALKTFPYSYTTIVERVLPLISNEGEVSHEQFKGALYIILQNQLLVKHSWALQVRLWPALVTAPHSDKPSITALVKSIAAYIHSVDNWAIEWRGVAEEARGVAGQVCLSGPPREEVEQYQKELEERGRENMVLYHRLVDLLCDQVEERASDLHWRHYNTSLTMLCAMLRHDVDFPVRAVSIFTSNLVHENLLVRKASLHVIDCIMKKTKRPHPKIRLPHLPTGPNPDPSPVPAPVTANGDIRVSGTDPGGTGLLVKPGERKDNSFLQYGGENIPRTQEGYDQPRFVHKTHCGFYVWPEDHVMYAGSSEQPELDRRVDEMAPAEQVVFKFFSSEEQVERLVTFLCLENKKGHDRFDAERFAMFKGVFRNFGDAFLPCFRLHIERLVEDHRESHQRAASELLAAIVRGSKHWPWVKVAPLWAWLVPAIRTALAKVSPETQRDWGTAFATSSDSRDPNRLHWLMEVAMEEPIRCQGSFIDASRLYMLQGVVAQQRWRVGELLKRLLAFLLPFLHHPYSNVRSRLGAVLTNIFALDINFPGWGNASVTSPDEGEFVVSMRCKLEVLEEGGEVVGECREEALRLLQTLSKWVSTSVASSLGPVRPHLFTFLPLLLGFEWYDADPQLAMDCQVALSCLSRTPLTLASLPPMLATVASSSLATCWRTRVATLDFLQALVFNNFILLCSPDTGNSSLREQVLSLVLDRLQDSQVEVRVKAAQVLGGLVHCQFLSQAQFPVIIQQFREQLSQQANSLKLPLSSRHGAVLGLCAFVTAFPHSVPPLVPSLLAHLGALLHDQQPIPATVKKTLQSFKRTHQDNWAEHKAAFTEDQLTELTNLLVSPSYYA